ncbi:hypothetical protein C4578_03465, partial [Candidatus Microgenomates bacterium]
MTERTGKVRQRKKVKKLSSEGKILYQKPSKKQVIITTPLRQIGKPIFRGFLFLGYGFLLLISFVKKTLGLLSQIKNNVEKISLPKPNLPSFSFPKINLPRL